MPQDHAARNDQPASNGRNATALDELTELIVVVPPHLREQIVAAALQLRPTGARSFTSECAIGVIRAAISNVFERHFPDDWERRWRLLSDGDPAMLASRLKRLAASRRPAFIRQRLAELLLQPPETLHEDP
jgi:hypothetical protein